MNKAFLVMIQHGLFLSFVTSLLIFEDLIFIVVCWLCIYLHGGNHSGTGVDTTGLYCGKHGEDEFDCKFRFPLHFDEYYRVESTKSFLNLFLYTFELRELKTRILISKEE